MHLQVILYAILLAVIFRILTVLYQSFTSPLRNVPGPFQTRLTKLWFFNRVRLGDFEHDNIALHRKYGSIVRIAPDHYSIDDPDVIKQIYGIGSKFPKSDWYEGWKHPSPDRWTLFPDRNMTRHAETRKRFQSLFSMTSLVSYETFVDECALIFSNRLREIARSGLPINMGHWFQCYAFDVIACITFGRRFGFLDHGDDIDGTISALDRTMTYSTLVGIYPSLHPVLFYLSSKLPGSGAQGRVYLMNFVQKQIDKRRLERKSRDEEKGQAQAKQHEDGTPEDFLEKIMNANEADPSKVTNYHIFMMGLSNIIAGSDTTAVSLSAILYYLIRNPRCMANLRSEIRVFQSHYKAGNLSITFKQSQDMPYLQAVIKESLRLHPATGLPLWRVVPQGGAQINSHYFPAGTVLGVNTWVAHRNASVFGSDAEEFRPERWIEADVERLRSMEAYWMPFGLGSRTCLGKHISLLEIGKLVPRLVRDFDFELVKKGGEWETINHWFVKPKNFEVKVRVVGMA